MEFLAEKAALEKRVKESGQKAEERLKKHNKLSRLKRPGWISKDNIPHDLRY